jgi:hypothetical protein
VVGDRGGVGGEVFGDLPRQSPDGEPDRRPKVDVGDDGNAEAGAARDAGAFLEQTQGGEDVLCSPGELLVALVLGAFLTEDATTGKGMT